MPTLTLAEIYLAQGHAARARAIVREILRVTPDDEAAKTLLAKIAGSESNAATKGSPVAGAVVPLVPLDVPMAHAATDPGGTPPRHASEISD